MGAVVTQGESGDTVDGNGGGGGRRAVIINCGGDMEHCRPIVTEDNDTKVTCRECLGMVK